MKSFIFALCLFFTLRVSAFELDFATHFDQEGSSPQWNHVYLPPYMGVIGTTWIRDNTDWVAIENVAKGTYGGGWFAQYKIPWMLAAHQAGLKVVGCVDAGRGNGQSPPATWYANAYDPTGYANACAWLATATVTDPTTGKVYPLVDAIEILNEPNNTFRSEVGATWLSTYVNLANAAYTAIKAANPKIPVLACGMQGQDVISCLTAGITLDGITYHPYDLGDHIPEHAYEPPFTDYALFAAAVRTARPGTPIWTTEAGPDYGDSEYQAAVWNARRYLLQCGLGIEHPFFYQFIGDGEFSGVGQSWLSYQDYERQSAFVITRILSTLQGLGPTKYQVTTNLSDPDFKSFVFSAPKLTTVAAVWIGNHAPSKVTISPQPEVASVQFTLDHTHYYGQSYLLDVITGATTPILEPGEGNPNNLPQWSGYYGPIVNVPVSERPVLIVVP